MSTENMNLLKEEAELVESETLLRYIRVFSDLSNQLRYATQKRVLIEVALIRLTRPQMEENLDSIIERVRKIEQQLEDGVFTVAPDKAAAAGGAGEGGTGAVQAQAEPLTPAERVELPKGQLEDLNMVRNEWGKIIRDLGGPIRALSLIHIYSLICDKNILRSIMCFLIIMNIFLYIITPECEKIMKEY